MPPASYQGLEKLSLLLLLLEAELLIDVEDAEAVQQMA